MKKLIHKLPLPGIPSEEEISKNGYNVNEMDEKFLEENRNSILDYNKTTKVDQRIKEKFR